MSAARQRTPMDWGVFLSIQGLLLAPMVLLFAAGYVEPSSQARRALLPVWIVLGLVLFAWTMRTNFRRIARRGQSLDAGTRVVLVALFVALSGIATFTLSLGLPALAHRWVAQRQDVQTVVSGKSIHRGKSISYCLETPDFDPRIEPVKWCTGRAIFDQAHMGEAILLHGTTSWFGFKRDHFDLLPTVPESEALKGGFLPAPTPRPAVTTALPDAIALLGAPAGGPLRAWPGDDLARLQAAYPGSPPPSPYGAGGGNNRQALRLADRGLWFFLAADGTINTVRVERPFADAVDGVHVGDALADVQRALAADGRRFDAGQAPRQSYVFEPSPDHHLRVDLDATQRVQTIFLFR